VAAAFLQELAAFSKRAAAGEAAVVVLDANKLAAHM
jgi:hypothetical protein